ARRNTVQLTPAGVIAAVGAGTAVVLVVGAVLVSLLLAVAITAASVAVCALVIRSLVASERR
ncbi:SpdD-like protein, partial [Streptomyces sp. NPDC051940]